MKKYKYPSIEDFQKQQKIFEQVMKKRGYIAKCPNCGLLNKTDKCELCKTHFDVAKYAI